MEHNAQQNAVFALEIVEMIDDLVRLSASKQRRMMKDSSA